MKVESTKNNLQHFEMFRIICLQTVNVLLASFSPDFFKGANAILKTFWIKMHHIFEMTRKTFTFKPKNK